MMAWNYYAPMLGELIEEEQDLYKETDAYLVKTSTLVIATALWPLAEVANAGYEFYLKYFKGDALVK